MKASPLRIVPWLLGGLALMYAGAAHAQFTGDYETNIISGTTVDWTGTYAVGSNTSYDFLGIDSGGVLVSDAGGIGIDGDSAGNDAVSVSGTGSVWSNANDLTIGYSYTSQNNSLTIANGGVIDDNNCTVLGNSNVILVNGNGSAWNNSGNITLGINSGQGFHSMTIADGGVVSDNSFSTSDGRGSNAILVTGPGRVWSNRNNLSLGADDDSLVISNGGVVYDLNGSIVEYDSVLVTGPGSVWSNSNSLFISGQENSVIISNGGAVYSASALLQSQYLFGLVVTGGGSILRVGGDLEIDGDQIVTIRDGGVVSAGAASSEGYITISAGGLYVTNGLGTGALTLHGGGNLTQNGGTVTVDSLIVVDEYTSFNLNGGTVNTKATTVSNGSLFAVGNGASTAVLNLDSGGSGFHSFANGLSISSNATLMGNGTIVGSTVVNGGGALAPGAGPGSITFSNSLTLAVNSTFAVELDGAAAGQYDQIVTLGTVSLSNSVLSLTLGYTPSAGDSFTVVSNQGPSAVFGAFVDPQGDVLTNNAMFIEDGTTFEINYGGNTDGQDVTLTAVVPEPAAWLLAALGCGGLGVMRWQIRSEA